jgi:hypothetical protein
MLIHLERNKHHKFFPQFFVLNRLSDFLCFGYYKSVIIVNLSISLLRILPQIQLLSFALRSRNIKKIYS